MDTIRHYASFPATGVSLRQMVQFGEKPSTGKSGAHPFSKGHLDLTQIVQGLSFAHPSFSRRSFLSASPTASRSSRHSQMASTRCPRSRRFKTGMRSRLRYARALIMPLCGGVP